MNDRLREELLANNSIIRDTKVTNGCIDVNYYVHEKRFSYLDEALKEVYVNQGNLYFLLYGVSEEDAKLANWHPDDDIFNHNSTGWQRFLKAGGKIEKESTSEFIDAKKEISNDNLWAVGK